MSHYFRITAGVDALLRSQEFEECLNTNLILPPQGVGRGTKGQTE